MFGFSYAKLIGTGIGLLAVLAFIGLSLHWRSTMTARGQQLATICTATRLAADNPKLDCKRVPEQIAALGSSLKSTTDALERQNAAVKALNAETVRQQKDAAAARKQADKRAEAATAVAQRLAASAAQAQDASGAACEASEALKEAWK